MTKQKASVFGLIIIVLAVILLQQAGVISLHELFRSGAPGAATEESGGGSGEVKAGPEGGGVAAEGNGQNWAAAQVKAGTAVSFEAVRRLIASADAAQRRTLLADAEKFRQFIEQEARNQAVLDAALANDLHQDPDVRFLTQRAVGNVIREIYLNRLINKRIPDDFPSEAQVGEYYDKNREQFRLGDRLHVWQVFLHAGNGPGGEVPSSLEKKAASIAEDIRSGKISFSRAALEFSAHQPSRNNGGYMGLVKVDELRPELAEPILDLEQGEISEPVRSEEGIHIVRKGEAVPGREVELDEVRDQVRTLLRNQAGNRLREAVYKKAAETYPVTVDEKRIEEWRLRLRTDTPGTANDGDAAKQ